MEIALTVCVRIQCIKGGISLKIQKLHIHLYFIATKYKLNNAFVEYIDD